jgi:hypothetical protein
MSKLVSTLINELTNGAVVGLPHVVAVGLGFESRLLPIFGQIFLVYLLKNGVTNIGFEPGSPT